MKAKEKIKKQVKGITLIALVVTIIVLLILAGVAINLTIGQNGIFTRAQNAVDASKTASDIEALQMAVIGAFKTDGTIDKEKLNENLPEGFRYVDGVYINNKTKNKYKINDLGEITLDKEITYNKEYKKITASRDNRELEASEYKINTNSKKWVVLVHGYCGDKEDNPGGMIETYINAEYNVLVPEMRFHKDSKDFTFGWIERYDLLDWVDYIINKDNNSEIVLHGFSMGGATVSVVAGEDLPKNIKAIISDSGGKDLNSFIEYCAYHENGTLQIIVGEKIEDVEILKQKAIETIKAMLSKYNIQMQEVSAMEQVKKAVVPMLFLHGKEDMVTNPDDTKELFDCAKKVEKKNIKIFEGMGHCLASHEKKEEYWRIVKEFIDSI